MEIRLKEGRKKNFESKFHDLKVKSLKQQSTLVGIFSYIEEEEKKKKSKFIKFIKYITIIKEALK